MATDNTGRRKFMHRVCGPARARRRADNLFGPDKWQFASRPPPPAPTIRCASCAFSLCGAKIFQSLRCKIRAKVRLLGGLREGVWPPPIHGPPLRTGAWAAPGPPLCRCPPPRPSRRGVGAPARVAGDAIAGVPFGPRHRLRDAAHTLPTQVSACAVRAAGVCADVRASVCVCVCVRARARRVCDEAAAGATRNRSGAGRSQRGLNSRSKGRWLTVGALAHSVEPAIAVL